MPDGLVRWPDRPVTPGRVAVVTVSYNTRELTALLLWSLRRILAWESLEIVVVDNGSKDGSAELLAKIDAAGGCRLIANAGNTMHGPALTQAMSFLASKGSELPRWVWVLDSDIVISRPDALQKAVQRAQSAEAQGETLCEFPFVKGRYVIHRGRSSLFAVWQSGDTTHPSHDWARDHHEPHFGLVEGAAATHDELMNAFRAEVGPLDDQKAVAALTIRDQGMVAVSTASTWLELKLETSTVPLGAAVMSLGNRPAGISPTSAGRPSSASATLMTVRSA